MNHFYIYDFENFVNFSCVTFIRNTDLAVWYFEISEWRNDGVALNQFLHQIAMSGGRMVGFNNVGYDYPVTHTLMQYGGRVSPALLFNRGQSIIHCENRWENVIWERDRFVPQVDLYLIHHFDNKAKQTSLKLLEFNMRMDDIQELPYRPDRPLSWNQSREIAKYNYHDCKATLEFFKETLEDIEFRDELSRQYNKDFTNHNDTKIGADIVKIELEKRGVRVHKSIQSIRDRIVLKDIIFSYIRFETAELNQVLEFFKTVVMSPDNLNGFFSKYDKETSATLDGFTFDFGAGGIHGSVENTVFHSDDDHVIIDIDYGSFYPNIAIKNGLYPEHLGSGWCDVMDHMYHERLRIGKKTKIGKAYKLALNGSYGKSNDIHSPFYDPQYTMKITINGQLLLCMLAELLMTKVPGLQMIFVNTDGLCCRVPRFYEQYVHQLCEWSDKQTGLELEFQNYKMIAVRDVNNYLGVLEDD